MILFFNTKIVNSSSYENNPFLYYPIMNPKNYLVENKYNFNLEVLKITLKSYSKINFQSCYFNIELENESEKIDIKNLIFKHFSKGKVKQLNFIRPSTLADWKESIKCLSNYSNQPIFTVFNHDHPYIDYEQATFNKVVSTVFSNSKSNFKKIFFYSHTPELMSLALNKKSFYGKYLKKIKNSLYRVQVNRTLDSFVIMTYETLEYVFNSVIKYPQYIGRLDWKGLYYDELKLDGYIYLREFFCHYEGYSHVSGLNVGNYLICEDYSHFSKEDLVNFYYNKWYNLSFLYLRDNLSNYNKRKVYLKSIERSIDIFNESYLLNDLESQIIEENNYKLILENLRSKIYYNSNELYIKLKTDKQLMPKISLVNKLKGFFKTTFIYRWIIRLGII